MRSIGKKSSTYDPLASLRAKVTRTPATNPNVQNRATGRLYIAAPPAALERRKGATPQRETSGPRKSQMTFEQRRDFVAENGGDAFDKLPW